MITPSEETRVLLKGVFYNGLRGDKPGMREGVTLSRKGILMTAYQKRKEGTLLRLWEQTGNAGMCEVNLIKESNFKSAYPCDLRGKIIDKEGIEISNNAFQFMIHANQPASLPLRCCQTLKLKVSAYFRL